MSFGIDRVDVSTKEDETAGNRDVSFEARQMKCSVAVSIPRMYISAKLH